MKKIIFLLVVMFFLSFVVFLMQGINVKSINTRYFSLEDLHFSLEQKLILRLKSLQIHKQEQNSSASNSTKELTKFIENADILGSLFKEISLEKISFGDTNLALFFNGGDFTLDTKHLALVAKFDGRKASINHLELKDFKASFSGDVEVDFAKESVKINGDLASFDLKGRVVASVENDILKLDLSDVRANSIDDFMENLASIVPMDKEIKAWAHEYVKAGAYHVEKLNAVVDIKNQKIQLLEGRANASDVKVFFGTNPNYVNVKRTNITLKDDILSFELDSPKYLNKDLNGSKVSINNVVGPNSNVVVNVRSKDASLNDAAPILKHFDIDLSAIKSDAKTATNLDIKVELDPLKVIANGNFIIKEKSAISISGGSFITKKLNLDLNNTKLSFKNSHFGAEFFDIDFSGNLDITSGLGQFDSKISRIDLGQIAKISDLNSKISLDMNKNYELIIPELDFIGNFGADKDGLKYIKISDLTKLVPHSQLLKNDLNVSAGSVDISTKDFTNFNAKILTNFDIGAKDHLGNPYNNDELSFEGSTQNFKISSKSSHVSAKNTPQTGIEVTLNDLFIPLKSSDKDLKSETKITYIGNNSGLHLLDFNRTFGFSKFKAVMAKGFDFSAHYGDTSSVNISKDDNSVSLRGLNMSEQFINEILGIKAFESGRFNLKLDGKDFSSFKAKIDANSTYLVQFKAQQNLINFFDSVPSLISFKVPDFGAKGFEAKSAVLFLKRNANLLELSALKLSGPSADISGSGQIDLNDKSIKMQLQIDVLKSASSLISKIPVVSKIILGDDEKITTVVDVSGTLDNPKYSTSTVKDILSTPYNLIKNTLTLPFNLFK